MQGHFNRLKIKYLESLNIESVCFLEILRKLCYFHSHNNVKKIYMVTLIYINGIY